MGELEEKLESVLNNPDAMAQIMSLAQSLNAGGGQFKGESPQEESAPPAEPPPAASPAPQRAAGNDLLEGLSSLDPKLLSAAAGLFARYQNGNDDKRVALLNALRPFVRKERYAKLDKAIQIAKLSRLIRSAVDLFRAAKEDGHV